jgi:peptidoglycan/xylan/chitin deacetylase (PgdA/CDA1 family)
MHGDGTDQRGSVVISIDAELGWGFHDLESPPRERIERSREGWLVLANLLDEYDVPATWAIVGHLLLEDCDGTHADHPAGEEWFAWDGAGRRDLRFADGLVDRVVDSAVGHEIACHTFSHVLFGDSDTSREVAVAELEHSRTAFADAGLEFTSFVFPRNQVGHRDVLAEYGVEAYRGGRAPDESTLRTAAESLLGTYDPHLPEPTVDEYGLVYVPPSQYLFGFEGIYHEIAEATVGDPVVAQARLGIDAAAESGGLYHMWLHPNNLVSPRQRRRIERILRYLDANRHRVRVETMADVASRVQSNESAAVPE